MGLCSFYVNDIAETHYGRARGLSSCKIAVFNIHNLPKSGESLLELFGFLCWQRCDDDRFMTSHRSAVNGTRYLFLHVSLSANFTQITQLRKEFLITYTYLSAVAFFMRQIEVPGRLSVDDFPPRLDNYWRRSWNWNANAVLTVKNFTLCKHTSLQCYAFESSFFFRLLHHHWTLSILARRVFPRRND